MHTPPAWLVRRCLLVEDDRRLRECLGAVLADHVGELRVCGDVASAVELLAEFRPELVIADFEVEQGTAFDVLACVEALSPAPAVVVISGRAGAEDAFELSERGVRSYVQKPITPERLLIALRSALESAPRLEPKLRAAVGALGLHEVEAIARKTMIDEALARKRGSRRGAAELLRVSRQLLQHALRALSD